MTIKQFNATYLVPDDRLLFRFNTSDDLEYRFWLTRRITLFILSATQHLIVKGLEQKHSPDIAKAIADFDKEVVQLDPASKGISHTEEYQVANKYPIGADPVLVMKATCTMEKQGNDDGISLDLGLPGGANVNVKLVGPTLQAMCSVLNQLREHASWGEISVVTSSASGTETTVQEPLILAQKGSVH
jgi:hypothetical protein